MLHFFHIHDLMVFFQSKNLIKKKKSSIRELCKPSLHIRKPLNLRQCVVEEDEDRKQVPWEIVKWQKNIQLLNGPPSRYESPQQLGL